MHPIEYLRYLARSGDAPASWLVPEAAEALGGLVHDRNALVMGSRKLLESIPLCGPLWWLCGEVLVARDPRRALGELVERFDQDPTPLQVSLALSDVDIDDEVPPVYEATLVSPAGVVVSDAGPLPPDARVWVVAGLGTVVPEPVFAAATARAGLASGGSDDGADAGTGRASARHDRDDHRLVALDAVARMIRPSGTGGAELARSKPDVPFVPELLARH